MRSQSVTKKITFEVPVYLEDLRASLAPLLLVGEAAEAMRMHPRTLQKFIARGVIKAVRAQQAGSSRVLVPRSEVIRFLTERPSR